MLSRYRFSAVNMKIEIQQRNFIYTVIYFCFVQTYINPKQMLKFSDLFNNQTPKKTIHFCSVCISITFFALFIILYPNNKLIIPQNGGYFSGIPMVPFSAPYSKTPGRQPPWLTTTHMLYLCPLINNHPANATNIIFSLVFLINA